MNRKKIATLALAGLVALPIVGCSTQIPAGQKAVKVEDYAIIPTAPELIGCQDPETSAYNPIGGYETYPYPTRLINYDMTGERDQSGNLIAEAEATVVVSNAKAPAELRVPIQLTFDMTSDCDALQDFHREIATQYSAWLNDDGSVSAGYLDMLRNIVGLPAQQTLIKTAQKYTWREIWNDENVRVEFQNALRETLPETVKARTGGREYFNNFTVVVGKPTPVDQNLVNAITAEQSALAEAQAREAKGVADAKAAEAQANAEVTSAEAQTKVAQEKAKQRQAEVSGYPSEDTYLKQKAIDAGITPWPAPIVTGMPVR
ncbi:hypothetical protein PBI_TOURACH_51 [Mycobacterium phage Tourach]|uniref:Band-7-like membrane protein n=1 Tax=Mycobacterium phage Tourach TaxID=2599882 RepID=A0A5J6TWH4_9CAUD|nr:hypothetical protein J4T98_gp051 [Mycobacterium phage Tourach]QFG14289.1 hypothetical protein PBI_TOURACH_51 [Mycobacterium phage Tourach]